MPTFDPQVIADWASGEWRIAPPEPVRGFAFDSRKVEPGDLFVCLRTDRRDGHAFLEMAREKGAAGAIVSRADPDVPLPQLVVDDPLGALQTIARRHRDRLTGPLVGVTGSCGKTSTKDLLGLLCEELGGVFVSGGNFNNHIGVPVSLLGWEAERFEHGVQEAGINLPGEMALLADIITPSHAVITAVAPVHLENLESIEGIAREKAVLGRAVPAGGSVAFPAYCLRFDDFHEFTGHSLIAARDGEPLGALPKQAEVFRYSVQQEEEGRIGLEIQLPDGGNDRFRIPKVSEGMASNAVLAILTAWRLGCSSKGIAERLLLWRPAHLRGELVRLDNVSVYADCYNANPASLEDSVRFFQEITPGEEPRMYLLGCMGELGENSAALHREAGRKLSLRENDCVYVIGSDAEHLRDGVLEANSCVSPGQLRVCETLEEMFDHVSGFSGYVFLKGSRVYRMERVIEWLRGGAAGGKEVAC